MREEVYSWVRLVREVAAEEAASGDDGGIGKCFGKERGCVELVARFVRVAED